MLEPKPWAGRCQRCGRESDSYTGSWFDTALICLSCSEVELSHPDLQYAHALETEEVKRGDLNFEGVGWPGVDGRVPRPNADQDDD